MDNTKIDGIVFLPEMMDEVVLTYDLGPPVSGRRAVAAVIARLAAFYESEEVMFTARSESRDIRVCKGRLKDGPVIQLISVALRDPSGWVCELRLGHDPMAPVKARLDDGPA